MATVNWSTLPASSNALTTELNSLANGSNKIMTSSIDNTTTGHLFAAVEMSVATQGSARSAGAYIALYIVKSVDGTNFEMGSDSVTPGANALVGVFPFDAATTARRVAIIVQLPPTKYYYLVQNQTGQALAASGNTLIYAPFDEVVA
jgi:hypothetical protein